MGVDNHDKFDVYDNKAYPNLNYRAVPFGMPKTRNNEINNPGRQQYLSNNGFCITNKTDVVSMYWLDENLEIGRKTEWQSGPSDGNAATDQISKHAGY